MHMQDIARRPASRTIVIGSALLVAIAIVVAIVAIVSRPAHGVPVPRGTTVVHVDEHDFGIQVQTTHLHAGNFVFVDTNHGPSAHELVMWKTTDPADRLPLRANLRVNEDSPQLTSMLDSGSSLRPGETRILTAALGPGHYVVVCNLPGHYHAGMHVDITVT